MHSGKALMSIHTYINKSYTIILFLTFYTIVSLHFSTTKTNSWNPDLCNALKQQKPNSDKCFFLSREHISEQKWSFLKAKKTDWIPRMNDLLTILISLMSSQTPESVVVLFFSQFMTLRTLLHKSKTLSCLIFFSRHVHLLCFTFVKRILQ